MEGCFVAGADPELMLINPEGGLISAIGKVPGTKTRPRKVKSGAVQHDNVMAEFNISPANDSEEFENNMRDVLKALAEMVAPNRLTVRASADFPEEALRDRKARIFGCDPDFNSWTLSLNQIPAEAAASPFRSAGGHLHIGKKPATAELLDNPYGKIEVVKMLDVFVGIPSVILDPDPTAPARRSLYGRAGAHRPKPYGVEYRALGNFWVRSPSLAILVYELADVAVRRTLEGTSETIIRAVGAGEVQETINNSDNKKARSIFRKLIRYIPKETMARIQAAEAKIDLYQAWGL